jgi:hypothetical protein
MATKEEIIRFLKQFQEKKKVWSILFRDDRGKNIDTLSVLEISPNKRIEIIDSLKAEDYSEGPLIEKLYRGSDMWVFGRQFKNKEIYIKISIGFESSPVICISFHVAEFPMNYPYK